MISRTKRTLIIIGASSILFGVLILHSYYYMPFLSDDSLISLRYASRVLEGKGLTWTEGHPVEGYSNLLWILVAACLGAFGMDLIDAVRILGVLGMGSVILSLLWWYTGKGMRPNIWCPLALGLLFYCLAAPIAVWAIGGMEQPLCAALIGISIFLMCSAMGSDEPRTTSLLVLSFILGLLCITRPDGPIFTIAAVLVYYVGGRFSKRQRLFLGSLLILIFPILFYGGQLVFRLLYYGEIVPNTALVKITPSLHHFSGGLKYVANGMWVLFPFSLLAIASLAAIVCQRQKRDLGIFLVAITVLWISYIVFVGGDVFPAYRHLVPIIVVFAVSLIEGFDVVLARFRGLSSKKSLVSFGAVAIILFVPYVYAQFENDENQRAVSERWEWDGQVLGLLLKEAFSEQQPLMAVTAAGCLPYWSELPAVDMLGLNDYYLPRHPPADVGKGFVGHELGDGEYVLGTNPDIICFHVGTIKAIFRSGVEMQKTRRFFELYTPVEVQGTYPRRYTAFLWFLKYSNKIGIHRTKSRITVPGFLLNEQRNTVAHLDGTGKLVVSVRYGKPVRGVIDSVPHRHWDIDIKTPRRNEIRSHLEHKDNSLFVTLSTSVREPIEIEEIMLTSTEAGEAGEAGEASIE